MIRASRLPIISRCRRAACDSQSISVGNDATAAGRAWHKVAERLILGEDVDPAMIAAEYGVGVADVDLAIERLAFLREVRDCEDGHVWIFDYKTGWGDADPAERNIQLIAYAVLVMDAIESSGEDSGIKAEWDLAADYGLTGHPDLVFWRGRPSVVHCVLIYPRQRRSDHAIYSPDDLGRWRETIKRMVAEAESGNADYRVGDHCARCANRLTCPAIGREVVAFGGSPGNRSRFDLLAPEEKGRIYEVARAVESAAAEIIKLAKAEVDAGREIILSDGRVLARIDKPVRQVDVVAAWPVIKDYAECLSVSLTALEAAYVEANVEKTDSGRAKPGERKRASEALYQILKSLGAITTKSRKEYRALVPGKNNAEQEEGDGE
jgi:hypothetical protein